MNQLSFSTDSLVESGHFLYHASVLTRRPGPKASETIPAILLEAENSRCSAGPCCRETKTQSYLDTTASVQAQPTVRLKRGGVINKDACLQNNSNDDLESLIRRASPDGHRSELIPVTITPDCAKGYLSFGVEQEREIDQSVIDDYALDDAGRGVESWFDTDFLSPTTRLLMAITD